jgi:hypothetical protein
LYGFTQEEIFDKQSGKKIREISGESALKFPINHLMDWLERNDADAEAPKVHILRQAESLWKRSFSLLTQSLNHV